jgi:signal transduction histidine kinase
LHLRITDQGIGIPEADLPRLFGSFHRGTNVGNIPAPASACTSSRNAWTCTADRSK